MERPILKQIGTLAEELDPSSLVVDIGVLEKNIATMHSYFDGIDVKLRPHVDSHLCPAIAHMQLAASGTVDGIATTTLGQAEAFVQSGFTDVFVTNMVVTPQKIDRLCALSRQAKMTIAVDNQTNANDLSASAAQKGVTINVAIDVDTSFSRYGVKPGAPAVDLAKIIVSLENLEFAGLMTYESRIFDKNTEAIATESRRAIQKVLDTRQDIEKVGIDVGMVSVGGTSNYQIAAGMSGVTEVPAGTYALMDGRYRPHCPQFQPAAHILGIVVSTPEDGIAIMDAGGKTIGADIGQPTVENIPGVTVRSLSAEHGNLVLAEGGVSVGDKVWVLPWDVGLAFNLHDFAQVVRDGRLESVWDLPARGRYR